MKVDIDINDIRNILLNMEEELFELYFTITYDNQAMSERLDKLCIDETNLIIEMIKKSWHDFNDGMIKHFEKLNNQGISQVEKQQYLKAALEYVSPNNFVQLLNMLFNKDVFHEIQRRYENTFNKLINNHFASLIERYRIPNKMFKLFSFALMEKSKELAKPLEQLTSSYVNLLETFKAIQESNDDDLFYFGAGVLGSVLAGPIGGITTRSLLKAMNSKEKKINQAILKVYDSLEVLHNKTNSCLMYIHKIVLYINYTIYVGLFKRIEEDLRNIGYVIKDFDLANKKITFSLANDQIDEITSWYHSIQHEVTNLIKKQHFKEADVISQHLLQFFVNNPYARDILVGDFALGYRAAILRYTVLTQWLQNKSNDENLDGNTLDKLYNLYSRLFQDFNIGVNEIPEINGINVPPMLQTVFHYIHLTERLSKLNPEKGFQLRTNTINILLEYVTNFSEKKLSEDSFAFRNEYIDKDSLALISCYQVFLKSINMTTVSNVHLKRNVPRINYNHLLSCYQQHICLSLSESKFYHFLSMNQTHKSGKQQNNRHLFINRNDQKGNEEADQEEKNLNVLQTIGLCEMYVRIYNGELRDTKVDHDKWFSEWNKKVEFRTLLFIGKRKNDAEIQYQLGLKYYYGNGISVNHEEAYQWFLKAANQDHVNAIEMILKMHYEGKYIEKNPSRELKWYLKLEEELSNKNEQNQLIIGSMYREGYGTKINYQKAYEWFLKAANNGSADAKYEIGKLYEHGLGRSTNISEAKKWYEKALKKGHEEASIRLDEIKRKERKARFLKTIKVTFPILVVGCVIVFMMNKVIVPHLNYNEANELLIYGDEDEAIAILKSLGDYKDSKEIISRISYKKANDLLLEGKYNEARKEFMNAIGYRDAKDILQQWNVNNGIAAGWNHSVGLKEDGTVIAVGENTCGQLDIDEWENIIMVAVGGCHTIGLKEDGTLVTAGDNEFGQIQVEDWTDIVAISAGGFIDYELRVGERTSSSSSPSQDDSNEISLLPRNDVQVTQRYFGNGHTVGLKSDGTVLAVGNNDHGQLLVEEWTNMIAIAAGGRHTVGLKSDGTVLAVGNNEYGQLNVDAWQDIIAIAAGFNHTVGLKSDGTVVATGSNKYGETSIGNWHDIVTIEAGVARTIGLKSNGTVVAVGHNSYQLQQLTEWQDIVAIAAGNDYVLGLKENGTVVAINDNEEVPININEWTNISLPAYFYK